MLKAMIKVSNQARILEQRFIVMLIVLSVNSQYLSAGSVFPETGVGII